MKKEIWIIPSTLLLIQEKVFAANSGSIGTAEVNQATENIKNAVVKNHADFGIAFDGDSDRIGIIDSQGNSMTGDKLLLIYAQDIIENLEEALDIFKTLKV